MTQYGWNLVMEAVDAGAKRKRSMRGLEREDLEREGEINVICSNLTVGARCSIFFS